MRIYNVLYMRYGPRHWWPADNAFEVCVGAILTQNTNWQNVEKALTNLKEKKALTPRALFYMKVSTLARLIRPCGYYNIKARRLKNFISSLFANYSGKVKVMSHRGLKPLRKELIEIKGIGPETADSIMLYALRKPIFVVDAYTKRIMSCLGIVMQNSTYDEVQGIFMKYLPKRTALFNEYHALLVEHAKLICKTNPRCEICVLRKMRG